jgi:hypothetical protein
MENRLVLASLKYIRTVVRMAKMMMDFHMYKLLVHYWFKRKFSPKLDGNEKKEKSEIVSSRAIG